MRGLKCMGMLRAITGAKSAVSRSKAGGLCDAIWY